MATQAFIDSKKISANKFIQKYKRDLMDKFDEGYSDRDVGRYVAIHVCGGLDDEKWALQVKSHAADVFGKVREELKK